MITHSIACWWCLFHWLHVGPDNKTENMKMVIPPPPNITISVLSAVSFFFCRKEGCRWWKCRYGWYSKENDTCQRYCLCVCFSFRWFIVDQGACVHIKAYNSLSANFRLWAFVPAWSGSCLHVTAQREPEPISARGCCRRHPEPVCWPVDC